MILTHFETFRNLYAKSVMVKVHEILRVVRDGNAEALEVLLRQDRADVNKFNEKQRTPLMVACEEGNPHVVQILLTHGADVNRSAYGKPSALMLAVEHRHAEVVKLLMQHNPDTSYGISAMGGGTLLSHALHQGLHDMADLLLQCGVDINERDKKGITALMYAAIDGSCAEVEYLLNNGANLNLVCNTLMMMGQKTALLAAAMHDHAQVVRLLVDRGAELLPPHYREFLQRSEVEETEEARTCSALLRQAEANCDCRRRENAVDLTGADDDVIAALPPDPAQAGRGRGIMHAIPAWMQAQNEGLIPRHVETMREFQLFRQGDLPPPKRGPLYHPNAYAKSAFTGTGSSSSQFSDADESRRHKLSEKSSIHQPFEVDDFADTDRYEPPAKRHRGDSRSHDGDQNSNQTCREVNDRERNRSRSRSHSRSRSRNAHEVNGWNQDYRDERFRRKPSSSPHRSPPRFNIHNGAYEQDYHRVNYQYNEPSTATLHSPPRGASPGHHAYQPDNERYMINNALSNYTPKPPRPRPPPKPLLSEPVMLPDVDFVRSKGNPLPPGREVNSYAELERKRREAEARNGNPARENGTDCWPEQDNNNTPEARMFQNSMFRPAFYHEPECAVPHTQTTHNGEASATRRSPPRHYTGHHTTTATATPRAPLFTPPPPFGASAGRGRNATLPAWVTTDSTPTSTMDADTTHNGRKRGRDDEEAAKLQRGEDSVAVDVTPANRRACDGDVRRVVPPVIPIVSPTPSTTFFSISDLMRAKSPVAPTIPALTWLHGYLSTDGMNPRWIATCERVLVQEQGLRTRDMFAALPVASLDDAHLAQLGLTSIAAQMALRRLHARLNAGERSKNNALTGCKERDNGAVTTDSKAVPFGTGTDADDSESVDSAKPK